jgi:hypothetical protein
MRNRSNRSASAGTKLMEARLSNRCGRPDETSTRESWRPRIERKTIQITEYKRLVYFSPAQTAANISTLKHMLTEQKMKTLIALLSMIFVLVISAEAHATSVFVAKVPSVWRTPNGAAFLEFRHNPDSNLAWVSADLCDKYVTGDWAASECRLYNQHKIRVAGLVYDSSLSAIRLGRHVCAWVENGLGRPIYRQTGDCKLNIHTVRADYDNGFERYWRPMDVITIQLAP